MRSVGKRDGSGTGVDGPRSRQAFRPWGDQRSKPQGDERRQFVREGDQIREVRYLEGGDGRYVVPMRDGHDEPPSLVAGHEVARITDRFVSARLDSVGPIAGWERSDRRGSYSKVDAATFPRHAGTRRRQGDETNAALAPVDRQREGVTDPWKILPKPFDRNIEERVAFSPTAVGSSIPHKHASGEISSSIAPPSGIISPPGFTSPPGILSPPSAVISPNETVLDFLSVSSANSPNREEALAYFDTVAHYLESIAADRDSPSNRLLRSAAIGSKPTNQGAAGSGLDDVAMKNLRNNRQVAVNDAAARTPSPSIIDILNRSGDSSSSDTDGRRSDGNRGDGVRRGGEREGGGGGREGGGGGKEGGRGRREGGGGKVKGGGKEGGGGERKVRERNSESEKEVAELSEEKRMEDVELGNLSPLQGSSSSTTIGGTDDVAILPLPRGVELISARAAALPDLILAPVTPQTCALLSRRHREESTWLPAPPSSVGPPLLANYSIFSGGGRTPQLTTRKRRVRRRGSEGQRLPPMEQSTSPDWIRIGATTTTTTKVPGGAGRWILAGGRGRESAGGWGG